jgi:tripartite-type tricarboxylate transporter receptor subunit TctC
MLNRRELLAAGAASAAAAIAPAALAQSFPAKPVRIVVPWTAGGTGDIQARLLAQHMTQTLGQPVLVENKPGGGTIIGTGFVAKAPADGHTLLLMANSFVINAKLHNNLPYDGIKAFEAVACLTNSPQLIAVNAASPYRTFKDWVDAARAKPGTISYATVGPATTQHIAGEMLQRAAGIRLIYTPFGGGAPAVNAVLAGHVDTVLANVSEMSSFLEAGKLRALAVTTAQRLDSLKQVPTVIESGYPGYEAAAWFGLVAPRRHSARGRGETGPGRERRAGRCRDQEEAARRGTGAVLDGSIEVCGSHLGPVRQVFAGHRRSRHQGMT